MQISSKLKCLIYEHILFTSIILLLYSYHLLLSIHLQWVKFFIFVEYIWNTITACLSWVSLLSSTTYLTVTVLVSISATDSVHIAQLDHNRKNPALDPKMPSSNLVLTKCQNTMAPSYPNSSVGIFVQETCACGFGPLKGSAGWKKLQLRTLGNTPEPLLQG